jgi:hypothetical protein
MRCNPGRGDRFSWGRYGSKFIVKRLGKRIFANRKKTRFREFRDAAT